MNPSYCAILILNVAITLTETEASSRWRSRWNKPKYKYWNWDQSKSHSICSSGECVQFWNCPEESVLRESTGSCIYWTNGPWVCCDLTNSRSHITTANPFKHAATNIWRETEGYNKNDFFTPPSRNRNARAKPTPAFDIPTNRQDRAATRRPVYRPAENPLFKTTTSAYFNDKNTKKRQSLDPRIVFPTEGITWTRRVTKYPVLSTATPKKMTTQVSKPITRSWVGDSDSRRKSTSTTQYPTQTYTSSRVSKRPRPTVRTTKRNRITTPLPDVNTHMCGIRVKRPHRNRQGRSYNLGFNPSAEVVDSGFGNMKNRQPYQRIVGGEEAEPFSWPWVAALYKVTSSGGHRFLSAGSLINGHFVLTAAHIFTPEDLRTGTYVVMLGTHDAQDAVAEYLVASVVQHPRYEHRYYYHDIALLRLSRPVIFNDYVMPVCLPSPNAPLLRDRDLEGKNVTVMGWGDESFGGKSSRVLKEATFSIVSRSSCNASYVRVASNRFPRGITKEMLCAGDPNGGKDACQGDSGGPLTSMVRGRYTQVGIVSFGYQCGNKEFPGVYTKVAPYLSWIAENTRSAEEDHDHDYHYDYD